MTHVLSQGAIPWFMQHNLTYHSIFFYSQHILSAMFTILPHAAVQITFSIAVKWSTQWNSDLAIMYQGTKKVSFTRN